jgi:hypothetical protein
MTEVGILSSHNDIFAAAAAIGALVLGVVSKKIIFYDLLEKEGVAADG